MSRNQKGENVLVCFRLYCHKEHRNSFYLTIPDSLVLLWSVLIIPHKNGCSSSFNVCVLPLLTIYVKHQSKVIMRTLHWLTYYSVFVYHLSFLEFWNYIYHWLASALIQCHINFSTTNESPWASSLEYYQQHKTV